MPCGNGRCGRSPYCPGGSSGGYPDQPIDIGYPDQPIDLIPIIDDGEVSIPIEEVDLIDPIVQDPVIANMTRMSRQMMRGNPAAASVQRALIEDAKADMLKLQMGFKDYPATPNSQYLVGPALASLGHPYAARSLMTPSMWIGQQQQLGQQQQWGPGQYQSQSNPQLTALLRGPQYNNSRSQFSSRRSFGRY